MEQVSSLSLSYLLVDLVGFLFFQPILDWVSRIHKFYHLRCLPLLQFQVEFFTTLSRLHDDDDDTKSRRTSDGSPKKRAPGRSEDDLGLSGQDVEMVMGRMGIFCDGEGGRLKKSVGVDDLSSMFEEKEPSLEEVMEAFCVFDVNGDGFIDAEELQGVLSRLGFREGSTPEECRRMIGAYDENGDGRIDFNEFVKFMECSFC